MITGRVVGTCVLAVLLTSACATRPQNGHEYPSATVRVPLRITNESADIVRVAFVSESGQKVPLGSVGPYGEATLFATLDRSWTGHIFAHRLSRDAATAIHGALDAFVIAGRTLVVRIGADTSFDSWQISN